MDGHNIFRDVRTYLKTQKHLRTRLSFPDNLPRELGAQMYYRGGMSIIDINNNNDIKNHNKNNDDDDSKINNSNNNIPPLLSQIFFIINLVIFGK